MPTPEQNVARAVPHLHEVIRNPAPVNDKLIELDLAGIKLGLGGLKTDVKFSGRAVPNVKAKIGSIAPVIN